MSTRSQGVAQDVTLAPLYTVSRCYAFTSPCLAALLTEATEAERFVLGWRLGDGCEVLRVDRLVHIAEPDGRTLTVDIDGDERAMSEIVATARAEGAR